MGEKNNSNKITIERIYDAPLKMVWEAWTDEKQAAKWWGPRGFTITHHDKDLRSGGFWHYTMHGPDGVDYENTAKYLEVEKYQRLVYDHGGHKDRPPLFRVTATFTDIGANKTKLNMSMEFESPEKAKEMKKFIKAAGGNGTWDRLAEYLADKQSGEDVFVIQRAFEAPLETVFDMWTNKDHFQHWMGPTGSTMEFIECNIKPGGTSFYRMELAGMVMYGKIEYKEISRPNKLIYKQWFSNKEGGLGKHPMAPIWPTYMLTTVNFFAEGRECTRIQLKWEIVGEASKEERATFNAAKAGMTGGWTGSFDKLEELLERFA